MTNDYEPDQPSKTTFLDDEDTLPPPPTMATPTDGGAAPLTGGMPKGGVFHS